MPTQDPLLDVEVKEGNSSLPVQLTWQTVDPGRKGERG